MKKFVLTCHIDRLVLSDFGVVLNRGDEIELSEKEINSSTDMLTALRHGGLTMKKKASPKVSVPQRLRPKNKPTRKPKIKAPSMEDRIKLMISETVEKKLSQILAAVEQTQNVPAPVAQTVEIDTDLMVATVKEALSGIQTSVVMAATNEGSTKVVVDDTPMFIPSGIVGDALDAEIDTEQESSKGSSVDAATEALRQLRKAKNKES